MRVSTQQFYYQNAQQLGLLQTNVNDEAEYLSSGKRVMTAKDDPVAYGTLAGYKDNLANLDKYQRNLGQAENRNSLQEVAFADAEKNMQELKQWFIQANNGSLTDGGKKSLAELGRNVQEQMIGVGNMQDESGSYIFSGFKTDTQAFEAQPDGSVRYFGDSGSRELQIAKNVNVEINQSGDSAFESVRNNKGDFSASYNTNTSGISLNKAVIVDRGAYNTTTNPPDYNFSFTSSTDLTVTDSNGATVYSTASYAPGQTIAFNGVEVQLNGNPLPGDDFDITPEDTISIFDTIKNAVDWMEVGVSPTDTIQHAVDYDEILGQIDEALNHMTLQRASAGVRLTQIDNQKSNHLDAELYLSAGRAGIEDLDFAKSISDFEQSKVSLQAAQQSFVQIKNLSLFNYL